MENQGTDQGNSFPQMKDVAIVLAFTFGLTIVAALIGALFLGTTELLLTEIIIILPAIFFVRSHKQDHVRVFRLFLPGKQVIFSSLLIAFGTIVLTDELDRLIQKFFPMPDFLLESLEELMKIDSTSELFIIVFSAVIVAGLCEEMLFRGFVQQAFENKMDAARAIVYSSLIFAIVHFNIWTALQITILGLVLGYMSWRSDSIIPSAILHGLNNGMAVLFINLGEERTAWYSTGDHVGFIWIASAAVALFFGFKLFERGTTLDLKQENINSGID